MLSPLRSRRPRQSSSLSGGSSIEPSPFHPPETGTVVIDGTTIEPDLLDHVKGLVEVGDWEKVPREAAVYVEDRLRVWADLESVRGGLDAFKLAVGPTKFPLGSSDSERQGWHQLATGFTLAIRNSGGHRLRDRDDLWRYAVGVLGTASLLLYQIRYQYGDPPGSEGADSE